jgi:hypothetical protein
MCSSVLIISLSFLICLVQSCQMQFIRVLRVLKETPSFTLSHSDQTREKVYKLCFIQQSTIVPSAQ